MLRDGVRNGHKKQVIMAPTGGGKTYLGLRIINEALKRGKRCVFVCDRTTLINQTSYVADSYGLPNHGVIQAGHWRTNLKLPFQIASVQTLARRDWPPFDIIVIDECHTQYKAWTEHVKKTDALVIGLSATPFSKGLGEIFSNLVNAATLDELTKNGVLVPLKVFSCKKVDMKGAETRGGEWTEKAAGERGIQIVGDVVAEWIKYAENRKTIVFGSTIAHCEEMQRSFIAKGIKAEVFCSDTTPVEREAILSEYKKPDSQLRVLISVEALAKGFDVPDVSCVCDVRPLRKSLSTAIQMWGRGLRSSPETNKKDCLLLDFSGNIVRFAEDFSELFYNGLDVMDKGEKLDKAIRRDDNERTPAKKCQNCGFTPCGKRCIACGHVRQKKSLVSVEYGEMTELFIGKSGLADNAYHLYRQLCTYAEKNSNNPKGRAYHLYKKITGVEPSKKWRFEDTKPCEITKAVANKIRQINIAYAVTAARRN